MLYGSSTVGTIKNIHSITITCNPYLYRCGPYEEIRFDLESMEFDEIDEQGTIQSAGNRTVRRPHLPLRRDAAR